jgi:hypothetical protein
MRHGAWISVAVAALWAVRRVVPEAVLKSAADVGGNFLQTFGGIYGVVVAFVVFVTWGEHNETQIAIEKEAVCLLELYRLLAWFPSWKERLEVREQLHRYALAVPAAHQPNPPRNPLDEHGMLDRALAGFLRHTPAEGQEERLYDQALSQFHGLNEARAHRLTVSGLTLPEGLKWFVIFGGVICVSTLTMLWVDSFAVHAVLIGGMTWVVVATTTIILDLDDPYTGDFVVDWKRFEKTAQLMEQSHCDGQPLPRTPAL